MTVCKYSIIRYVPDPLAGEQLNIGVIVIGPERIYVECLQNWKRIQYFAVDEDLGYLKETCEEIKALTLGHPHIRQMGFSALGSESEPPSEIISKMVASWHHSVQFSSLQPSLENPESLCSRLVARYLKEPQPRVSRRLGKDNVTARAVDALQRAIESTVANAPRGLVRRRVSIGGHLVPKILLDVALAPNRQRVLVAGQAVSFQITDSSEMSSQWKEAVYSLSDIHNRADDVVLGLLYAPPHPGLPDFGKAQEMLGVATESARIAGIPLIEYESIDTWADDLMLSIPAGRILESDQTSYDL